MERDSASIRHRTSRNARELTPEQSRIERISKSSERETKTQPKENAAANEAKYIVRGILNVGPPSPASSSSSSGSGGRGGGTSSSGSHAYRAKILRWILLSQSLGDWAENWEFTWSSNHRQKDSKTFSNILISNFVSIQIEHQKQKRKELGRSSSPESINLSAIGIVSNE